MRPEDWQKLQDVFRQAVELSGESRAAFLDSACAGNADLRADVDSMLEMDAEPGTSFQAVIHSAREGFLDDLPDSWKGKLVGNFRIVSRIAEGGMGAVYLGERADSHYEQQVAIKLLRPGIVSRDTRQRFISERQILANLDHPNIARLIDGGTSDNGVPYLVMEYIAGEPIDEFCDAHQFSVEQRLTLFRKVCSAVAYAHQNLIIHRDLKPANILVNEDGEPKLLDFGIAKLLDMSRFEQTVPLTLADTSLMTPDYASPEQIQRRPVTTASDIYSLGLVLYQLLVGCRAYSLGGKSAAQIEKAICEERPLRPSTAIMTGDAPASQASAKRVGLSQSLLSRRLSGDLDNIVMKALRKQPEHRYATAGAFSADIRRELAGLPVTARQPTWTYLTGKFLRRNTAPVIVAVAAVATLVGLVSFYTLKLAEQRDAANLARENEALERRHAEQTVSFMTGLFNIADPNESSGGEVTAREILDAGAARIGNELADQPLLQSRLVGTMADVYDNLGLFDEALSLQLHALQVLEAEFGVRHLDIAEALDRLVNLYYELGEHTLAAQHMRRSLSIKEALLVPPHQALARSLADLSWLAYEEGHTEDALDYGNRSLAMRTALAELDPSRENRLVMAEGQNNLGAVLLDADQLAEAEALFRSALAVREELLGDSQLTAYTLGNLAETTRNQKRYQESRDFAGRALAMLQLLLDESHPDVVDALNFLAILHYTLGDFTTARDIMREVVARNRRGAGTWYSAYYQSNLGAILIATGNEQEAIGLLEDSVETFSEAGLSDSRYHTSALGRLGAAYLADGNLAAARQRLEQAYEILHTMERTESADMAEVESLLGECLGLQGDTEAARLLLKRSYPILVAHWGEGSWPALAAAERITALDTQRP